MTRTRTLLTLLILLTLPYLAAAQAAQRPAAASVPTPAAMTNADVIKLVQARLGEAVIVTAIQQAASTAFDTSPDGLVRLKGAGATDAVLAAILMPRAGNTTALRSDTKAVGASVSAAPVPSSPGLPPREPGIYIDTGTGASKATPLEPTVFSQAKTGGLFASAMTYGIKKAKMKAVVRSAGANIRTSVQKPVFYFVFEARASGPGSLPGLLTQASSPNEFVLAQMDEKRDSRELVVGEANAFGASTGARSDDTVPFHVERLEPGVYRVTPDEELGPGEFCFFYAAATGTGGGRLFDFGIDEHK